MRVLALLSMSVFMLVVAQPSHAQTGGADPSAQSTVSSGEGSGGAEYGYDARRTFVAGTRAKRLPNGLAAAPTDAPVAVQEAIFAANEIVGRPYQYGGGHNRSFTSDGYDCSGTVSYALHGGGLLDSPLHSGAFMKWGKKGKGKWITVYAHGGHAWVKIAGLRLDTSAAGERTSSGKGPRWRSNLRGGRGFTKRHPAGL